MGVNQRDIQELKHSISLLLLFHPTPSIISLSLSTVLPLPVSFRQQICWHWYHCRKVQLRGSFHTFHRLLKRTKMMKLKTFYSSLSLYLSLFFTTTETEIAPVGSPPTLTVCSPIRSTSSFLPPFFIPIYHY